MPPLLQVVTDLQTRSAGPGTVQLPGDNGIERAARSFAEDFAQVGAKIGAMADHAAAAEGAAAGRQAGMDPEFRPTHGRTIRSDAYDRAGLQIAGANLKQQMAADFAAAYDQHPADPGKLAATLKVKSDAWMAKTIPELRPAAALEAQSHTFTFLRQAARAHDAQVNAQQAAALQTQLHDGLRQLSQQAFAAGLDPAADEMLARNAAALQARMQARGLRGQPLLDPGAAMKMMEHARQEVATSRTLGAFDRLPDVASKEAFIKKFREDFGAGQGTAGAYDFDHFHRVERLLQGELRAAKAESGAAARVLAEQVSGVVRMAEKGRTLPADELAALDAQVAALGPAAKAEKLDIALGDARQVLQWHQAAVRATPDELEGWLRTEKAKMVDPAQGGTPRQSKLVDHGDALLTNMRARLKSDPVGWADEVGLLKSAPLDLSSPASTAQSIAARIPRAEQLGAYYGQEAKYLRPDEVHHLAAAISAGGQPGAAALAAITAGAGERAPKIMKELHEAQYPAAAALGGLAIAVGADAKAVRDAQNGLALRQMKGHESLAPSRADARPVVVDVLGSAVARTPQDESAIVTVANAIYETRALREGKKAFDKSLYEQALREAVGERTLDGKTYGGVVAQSGWFGGNDQIILPPMLKQRGWRQAIDAITAEDLQAAGLSAPLGGDKKPVSLSRLKGATLIQAGSGSYYVATGDTTKAGQEGLVVGADGKPWVLDFNRLAPLIQRRRPDLFYGGK